MNSTIEEEAEQRTREWQGEKSFETAIPRFPIKLA